MTESRGLVRNDQELVRYLLGLLPDEETERLDEATIVDDDAAARLRIVENDLVDAYVAGTLAVDERARFEAVYFSSPLRREKVRFAERFLAAVDRAAAAQPCAPRPLSRNPRIPWSAAAAVFLLLSCGLLLLEHVRLRQDVTQSHNERTAAALRSQQLASALEEARAVNARTRQALEAAQAAVSTRGRPSDGRSNSGSAATSPLALVLTPQTRGIGPHTEVVVSPALDRLSVDLRLESNDFSRYRVDLKDPGTGRIVWRSPSVGSSTTDGGSYVSVALPADLLAPQHYVLEIAGLDGSGRGDPVASYTFQISRR